MEYSQAVKLFVVETNEVKITFHIFEFAAAAYIL